MHEADQSPNMFTPRADWYPSVTSLDALSSETGPPGLYRNACKLMDSGTLQLDNPVK